MTTMEQLENKPANRGRRDGIAAAAGYFGECPYPAESVDYAAYWEAWNRGFEAGRRPHHARHDQPAEHGK